MSEMINNREYRQKKLKELILKLHDGATVEQVQKEFGKLIVGITATEITDMEQALVREGMPVSDIQRLCDVHAAVFKGSIEDIHNDEAVVSSEFDEGHPVQTFKLENRAIETFMAKVLKLAKAYTDDRSKENKKELLDSIKKLSTIDNHYKRKENLLFPYMEKYGITAPPQVLWGVDDEIRAKFKSIISALESLELPIVFDEVNELVNQINEMIFKEEQIMIPMTLDNFTQDEWVEIEKASGEFTYTLIDSVKRWKPKNAPKAGNKPANETQDTSATTTGTVQKDSDTKVLFDAGSLTAEELNSILNTVPIDMTFVDANDRVKYFTQGKERVFERSVTIIGREVKNCHPPKSVHIVEQIVADLKSGKKDNEDFWIKMGDVFVYIRYFAVRNKQGKFLGTLEVSQNIKPIIELEGEKRLMS